MHKIFDAHDMAEMQGFKDGLDRIKRLPMQGVSKPILPVWAGKVCAGPPVHARIERGRWIADCDSDVDGVKCTGAEWVAPGLPFFCFSCGNAAAGGKARPVVFPKNKEDIEQAILERPMVDMVPGAHPIMRALSAKPLLVLKTNDQELAISRAWNPGESVNQLRAQHKLVADTIERFDATKKAGLDGNI